MLSFTAVVRPLILGESMKTKRERSKRDKLASIIQDLILSGAVLTGERIPAERELAERLGASRPTVHEALLQLQAKGLIIMRPRHGCIVNDFSSSLSILLLIEFYKNNRLHSSDKIEAGLVEFRQLILTEVIKKLIVKTKTLSLKERCAFFTDLENLADFSDTKNIEAVSHEDFEFYKTLIALAENPVFSLIINAAKEIFIYRLKKMLIGNDRIFVSIPENKREFVKALKAGKQKQAVDLMLMLTDPNAYRTENAQNRTKESASSESEKIEKNTVKQEAVITQ